MRIAKLICVVFLSWHWLFSNSARAQENLQSLYRSATQVVLPAQPLASPRQIIPLHGTWQALSNTPKLAGPVEVPGAFLFEGDMRFERTFRLADSLRRRAVRLHVQALNHEAQITINDHLVASHVGGYTAFTLDLGNDLLRFGQDNIIAIHVDNRLSPLNSLPPRHRPFGWRNEGGIIREISLEILPEIYCESSRFSYQLQNQEVLVEFHGQARTAPAFAVAQAHGLTAILEIWDAARANKLASSAVQALAAWQGGRQEIALSCRLHNPALWSPASPNLYALRVVVQEEVAPRKGAIMRDELWQETGFREIALANKELHLNGELLTLHGVNWVEEYGERAAGLDTARLQDLLVTLKQLGANALRVVGHPPHPYLPTLCDRAGILLLEELPLYYLTDGHFHQPRFAQIVESQLQEMVRRDCEHPCVLAWGLGVASWPSSPAAQKIVQNWAVALRQQDNHLIYAVTPPLWRALWQPHTDFLLVDWLKRGNLDSLLWMQIASTKLILPMLGQYAGDLAPMTPEEQRLTDITRAEEAQAEYYTRVLGVLREQPRAGGYFLHALRDWQGPMPELVGGAAPESDHTATVAVRPSDWSALGFFASTRVQPWGIVAANGRQRTAFAVVRAYNRGENGPALAGRHLPALHPSIFQISGIALILTFLFFLQRDRRLRANLRRVFVHPHGFYMDLYEHRKVAPFLTVCIGLTASAITAFLLAQFCYAFRTSLLLDQVLDLLLASASWKAAAIWLIWHPGWFMLWGTMAVFVFGLFLGFLFRLFGVLFGTSLPLSQYIAAVYWAWANVLLLGVLTPVFYRLLLNTEAWRPLLMVMIVFQAWLIARLFRAIRVMYMASYMRAALILIVVAGGLFFTTWLYLDRTRALTEYARYYFSMLRLIR